MYQRMGKAAYKADLSNTLLLAEYLGNPEKNFKSVHIAGTNGKGSTSHLLASVLQEAGYKVGLYTSPHLKDFRERIKINGEMIPKRTVTSFVGKHKNFFEENQLSFFEMTVGLAFDYFSRKKVDIAIVEVGLGGRLDSTNIVIPEVSVITNIGMDHMQFLGDIKPKIAREKAGIIKQGVPVVIGETSDEIQTVFEEVAYQHNTSLIYAEQAPATNYKIELKGKYQQKNKRTVVATLGVLRQLGWQISESHIQNGLQRIVKNTGLRGRWQYLRLNPTVICDTAHNREGLLEVIQQLKEEQFEKLHIVLGMVADKQVKDLLELFPKDANYFFCSPQIPRAFAVDELRQISLEIGLQGNAYDSVQDAYQASLKEASKNDLIYVGGSTFVVAEVL